MYKSRKTARRQSFEYWCNITAPMRNWHAIWSSYNSIMPFI